MNEPRPRVMVVFGGMSSEHGVSCLTAANVAAAIDRDRFDVSGVGITRTGRWIRVSTEQALAMATHGHELPSVPQDGPDAVLYRDGDQVMLASRDGDRLIEATPVDAAFALLHGPFGEDGTIQGLFEMMGLRYVGAGVTASAVGMDKIVMKQVLGAAGLPIGPYVAIHHEWDTDPQRCLDAVAGLEFPVFVKPARAGSSIGITRVTELSGVPAAVEEARRHDPRVIVEQGIDGREVECAVLGGHHDGAPRTSPPGEIRMHTADKFYDFEAKYLPENQVSLDIPAALDDESVAKVRQLAARTFQAIDCEGLARVDTFVCANGDVLINEINTMPGFTQYSMFPLLWQAGGLGYTELIGDLFDLALERPVGLR